MQTPSIVGYAQSVKTRFSLAVAGIVEQQKRLVEKYLLGFRLTDPMLVYTLAGVSGVPLEAPAACQIRHVMYMAHIYV